MSNQKIATLDLLFYITYKKVVPFLIPILAGISSITYLILKLKSELSFSKVINPVETVDQAAFVVSVLGLLAPITLLFNLNLFKEEFESIEKIFNTDQSAKKTSKRVNTGRVLSTVTANSIKSLSKNRHKISTDLNRDTFNRIREDLMSEINRLKFFSSLNLVIGIIVTVAAITVLVTTLNQISDYDITTQEYIYKLIPRVVLSVCIELFAFFFLRLYRSNFYEVKYYTNELTNIELKYAALRNAKKDKKSLASVVDYLAMTERNFILNKGQTTVDFQHEKYSQKSINKFFEAAFANFSNKKKTE